MQPRVLLVEDLQTTRKAYRRVLELEGLIVHEAGNLREAEAAMSRIAFHVVCLDLGLEDSDPSNFEGKKVLQELSKYNEGTKAIIVSQKGGDRAHDIAIEAYERFGLTRWLRKGQFSVEDFVSNVVGAARSVKLNALGGASSALEALIAGLDSDVWIDEALRLLRPRGGLAGLRDLLDNLAQDLAPVRPHREPALRANVDAIRYLVDFSFWSRAVGSAMTIKVHAGSKEGEGMKDDMNLVKKVAKSGLIGYLLKIEDEPSNYL